MVSALRKTGIPCSLRFDGVGESGHQLVGHLVADETGRRIGGEALLRIDARQVTVSCASLDIYLRSA
jgi:mediator of RNA polymerase II transcription subunit 17